MKCIISRLACSLFFLAFFSQQAWSEQEAPNPFEATFDVYQAAVREGIAKNDPKFTMAPLCQKAQTSCWRGVALDYLKQMGDSDYQKYLDYEQEKSAKNPFAGISIIKREDVSAWREALNNFEYGKYVDLAMKAAGPFSAVAIIKKEDTAAWKAALAKLEAKK